MRRIDGTSISPNHLAYKWTVEVKRGEGIKEDEKDNVRERGGGEGERRNTVAIHNQICNTF